MANELQIKLGAATTTVVSLAADLTANSVGGGQALLDNSTEKYPRALSTLNVPGSFSAAPTNLAPINLYMVRQDTDGTSDDTSAPTGSDVEAAEWVGAFPIYDTDEQQRVTIDIDLRGALKAYFYVENKCGVTANAGAGTELTVKITPYTHAPAP